ncbi:MAG: hypothetical protein QOE82_2090 [Thermoanaerobaculia bacterium]|nr:hypothetical protein [Thermoanaerobaculia bacterium]
MAERVKLIARGAALLLLVAATAYALQQWILKPLRCSFAASTGGAALERVDPANYASRRLTHDFRAELSDCECVSPPDVAIPMTRAAAAEVDGDRVAAIAEYQRALQIDRRPEIYSLLAMLQDESGNHAGAIDNLTLACAFDPKRISEIPYEDIRIETERRLRATYGPDWIR